MPNESNNLFINESLNSAFNIYINNQLKKESLEYNSFLCCIIRMLCIIYDEKELFEAFSNKDENAFDNILTKYGFKKEDTINFKLVCDKFYKFNQKQQQKPIKKKNKYFNIIQKYLIDMLLCKINNNDISQSEKLEFYNLLFTANSKDFYRKSLAVLLAYNPYEIDEYFKKQNLIGG